MIRDYVFLIFVKGENTKLKPVNLDLSSNTSFRDILTNPDRVTLTKKGKILGKIPLTISLFTYYSLKTKFVPYLKS